MTSVLFDAPGPRARRRHRIYTAGFVVLLGFAAYAIVHKFRSEGVLTAEVFNASFQTRFVQFMFEGLRGTLAAAGLAITTSVAFGALFAVGRLSERAWVRWPCTAVIEFFRAVPLVLLILIVWFSFKDTLGTLGSLVAGLTLYNGSVLAEVFRSGVNSVERGQREAAFALGMRKVHVMSYVLVPQAVRAMLPAIISQLVVALKDTSLGYLITYEEFLHAGKLIASNLDYDLPFIPVVMVISPIYIGMCMLLSWFAGWVSRREQRSPKTGAVDVAPAEPGTLLPRVQ
jgi:glutamate transport system permease protein